MYVANCFQFKVSDYQSETFKTCLQKKFFFKENGMKNVLISESFYFAVIPVFYYMSYQLVKKKVCELLLTELPEIFDLTELKNRRPEKAWNILHNFLIVTKACH